MNAFHRGACAAAVVLTLACANAARAQTFYTTNSTIESAIAGDVVVGHSSSSANSTNSSPSVILGSNGSIGHDVQVFNSSTFYATNSIGGSLSAYDNATLTVAPGATLAYALFADNHSTVNINGGTFSNVIDAFNNSTLNVSGGSFSNIYAYDSSVINFFGAVTVGTPNPNFGYLGAYTHYALGGSFSNGDSAVNTFLNIVTGSGATFTLNSPNTGQGFTPVPEPGSVALLMGLGVTGAGFAAKRRRQRA